MAVCFLWFQILLLTLPSAHSDVFTSVGQMTDLLLTERTLIGSLKDYIKAEEDKLEKIKQWANEVDDISEVAIRDPESFLEHPVNAFKLLRRLNSEWANIENLALIDLTGKFISNLTIQREVFPDDEDQIGGAKALMRLQDTYKLDTETIATGMLTGASPDPSQEYILTVDDCFDLGKVAFDEEDYHHALPWLTQALKMLDEGQKPYIVDEITILDYLSYTAFLRENYEDAVDYIKRLLELAPNHQRGNRNLIHFEFELFKQVREEKLQKEKDEKKKKEKDEEEEDEEEKDEEKKKEEEKDEEKDEKKKEEEEKDEEKKEEEETEEEKKAKGKQKGRKKKEDLFLDYQHVKKIYEALCRGEGLKMTPKRQSRLFCRYHDNNHPKYIIGPVKLEDEWDQPLIVRYYNIVTDNEIETMKELAKPRLKRAMVNEVKSGKAIPVPVNYRISKSAWLGTFEHPVLYYVNQRIGDLSGLDMTTAESLQVVNYGVGGHYEPHYDFRLPNHPDPYKEAGIGNRIATSLLYLSDVPAGGATVFPDIGLFLSPIKGSAVFWYNLYPSGQGDFKTRHAACPVLVGNKWVGNKWIHERGQEFRRRCGLKETD